MQPAGETVNHEPRAQGRTPRYVPWKGSARVRHDLIGATIDVMLRGSQVHVADHVTLEL